MEVESDTERQQRLSRAENAARKTCPGKSSRSGVFEWDAIDGFLIRTKVDRRDIERTWGLYGPSHKRFDPIANEWDLCYDFDPNTNAPTDDDIVYEFESRTPEATNHLPLPSISPTPPPETVALPASHWHRDLSGTYDMTIATNHVALPALDDLLYERYGFSPDAPQARMRLTRRNTYMTTSDLWSPSRRLT
jgi:hypothetical protein